MIAHKRQGKSVRMVLAQNHSVTAMTDSVAKDVKYLTSTSVNLDPVTYLPIVRIPWAVISALVFPDMKETAWTAKVSSVFALISIMINSFSSHRIAFLMSFFPSQEIPFTLYELDLPYDIIYYNVIIIIKIACITVTQICTKQKPAI